jgi:hypothetical protein
MGEYRRREAFHDWLNDHLMNVPYDSGDQRLQDPPVDHSTDCSGSMWRGLRHGAGLLYPPVLSWTMAREWVDSHPLSVDDALRRKGSLLYMGPNQGKDGIGDSGHVACTVGDGTHVLENPSTGHKFGRSNALGRNWTAASGFVGDDEVIFAEPPPEGVFAPPMPGPEPVVFAALVHAAREKAAQDMVPIRDGGVELKQGMGGPGSPDERVRTAQRAVNLAIDGKLDEDGEFGKDTHDAVLWFQLVFFRGMPWEQSGTVTTNTAAGVIFHLLLRNQSESIP